MPLPIADRVKDATNATGNGEAITLLDTAPLGYVTFKLGFGTSTATQILYCIEDPVTGAWETGFGTYTSATNTLNRVTVTATSSQTTSRITLSAGTKDVFCAAHSKAMLVRNALDIIEIPNVSSSSLTRITTAVASDGRAVDSFTIQCATPTLDNENGTHVDVKGGNSSGSGDAGGVGLVGGDAPSSGSGGSINLNGGVSSTYLGGDVTAQAGDGFDGGSVNLLAGNGTSGRGGDVYVGAGSAFLSGTDGGVVEIYAGDAGNAGTIAGNILIYAGTGPSSGAANGGNIFIYTGNAAGTGTSGAFKVVIGGFDYGVSPTGQVALNIVPTSASSNVPKIGFFGATPVVKPTGVAVTAAAIHTALVNLGLISA